jgi:hypothetical protein
MIHKSTVRSTNAYSRKAGSESLFLPLILLGLLAGGTGLWWMVSQESAPPKPQPANSNGSVDYSARLQEAEKRTDQLDSGWHFADLQARRSEIPVAKNGAIAVLDAGKTLTIPWSEEQLSIALMKLGALVPLSSKQHAALSSALAKDAPTLREAGRLADLSLGRYPVNFQKGPCATPLPHLDVVLPIQQLLFCSALKHIHDGELDAALRADRALLNAGRSIGDEPTFHSQVMRNSSYYLAAQTLERILAHGQPSDAALKESQELFADEAGQPLLLLAARSLRAGREALLNQLMDPTTDLSQFKDVTDIGEKPFLDELVKAAIGNAKVAKPELVTKLHAWLLSYLTDFVEIAKLPEDQQMEKLKGLVATASSGPNVGEVLIPDIDGYAQRFKLSLSFIRCSTVVLAVERYRLSKGKWPENLENLVPAYLPAIPLDPFDGKPLRYRQYPEGVVVYSIGTDGKDNEGKFDSLNTYREGTDIGIRLWNVDKRVVTKR